MIEIQNVSFEYEKSQGTLSHIDLNIQQGECIVLTGESGCGKTTITKLINGLIPHFVEGGTLSGTTIVTERLALHWMTELQLPRHNQRAFLVP